MRGLDLHLRLQTLPYQSLRRKKIRGKRNKSFKGGFFSITRLNT